MHETVLLSRVVRLIEARLADRPDARVLEVRLAVDRRSHLMAHDPASLTAAFALAAAGSRVEGASLAVDQAGGTPACEHCGEPWEADHAPAACAHCGAPLPLMVEEPEWRLKEIVIEECAQQ